MLDFDVDEKQFAQIKVMDVVAAETMPVNRMIEEGLKMLNLLQ